MIINLIRLMIKFLIIDFVLLHYQVVCISRREPPRVSTTLVTDQPITYWIGSAVKLRCPIEEIVDQTAFIEWKRNNVPVEFLKGYTVTLDGELAIDFARPADSGVYTCRAINGFGSIVLNVSIVITGSDDNLIYILDREHSGHVDESKVVRSQNVPKTPPEIKIPRPEVIKKLPSQTLELRCPKVNTNGTGPMSNKVRWFKDGRLIEKRRLRIPRVEIRGRRLKIHYVDYNDYATYHCSSAETNEILKVFKLTLNDVISDSALRNIDMIRVHPEQKVVKIGQDVTFECDFRTPSLSSPDIKWLKNCSRDEMLDNGSGEQPIEIDGSYYRVLNVPMEIGYPDEAYYFFNVSLKITNARLRDSGFYACLLNTRNSRFYSFGSLRVVIPDEEDYRGSQLVAEDLLIEIPPDDREKFPSSSDIFLVSGISTSLFIIIFIGLWYACVRKSCIEKLAESLAPKDQSPQQINKHSDKVEC